MENGQQMEQETISSLDSTALLIKNAALVIDINNLVAQNEALYREKLLLEGAYMALMDVIKLSKP